MFVWCGVCSLHILAFKFLCADVDISLSHGQVSQSDDVMCLCQHEETSESTTYLFQMNKIDLSGHRCSVSSSHWQEQAVVLWLLAQTEGRTPKIFQCCSTCLGFYVPLCAPLSGWTLLVISLYVIPQHLHSAPKHLKRPEGDLRCVPLQPWSLESSGQNNWFVIVESKHFIREQLLSDPLPPYNVDSPYPVQPQT